MKSEQLTLYREVPLREMVSPLLAWYDEYARILPWRENTDPYRVWVSEIMLQQTRVEAVKPYFQRFLEHLPTLQDLASAPEEELLKLWEGLGYYARVRNLQKAAQIICKEFGGVFPQEYSDIISLPGIGEYTAGAVSSISFGMPTPAVDGNVLRVVTRLTETYDDITTPALKKRVTSQLAHIYPKERCGDFTQSIMELGAMICTPNGFPKCEECPLCDYCKAFGSGTQMNLPVKAKKAERKQEEKTVFLLRCNGKIAVQKRKQSGLLAGLWEFPNAEGALSVVEVEEWLHQKQCNFADIISCKQKKHIFTHVEWLMDCYLVECRAQNEEFLWVTQEELGKKITLPTAFKKFITNID